MFRCASQQVPVATFQRNYVVLDVANVLGQLGEQQSLCVRPSAVLAALEDWLGEVNSSWTNLLVNECISTIANLRNNVNQMEFGGSRLTPQVGHCQPPFISWTHALLLGTYRGPSRSFLASPGTRQTYSWLNAAKHRCTCGSLLQTPPIGTCKFPHQIMWLMCKLSGSRRLKLINVMELLGSR